MATKFTINGIATGQTIEASQVSQSVQAFTAADAYDIQVSGSVLLTGSFIQQSGSAENVTRIQLKQVADSTASAAAPYTLPGSFGFVAIDSDGYLYSASASSGTQGAQGVQGETGVNGTQGENGTQGNSGPAGPQGAEGANGTNGAQGGNGAQGTAGSGGTQGDSGPIGPKGDTGANGSNGTQGAIGVNGPQGVDGTKGDTGGAGTQGANGNTGAKGDTGAKGEIGTKGDTGAGTQGANGAQGTDGTQGADGTQGTDGTKGDTGAGTQGANGAQGTDGAKGEIGVKGDTGAGTQGANGAQGADGTNGTNGTNGAKGDTGAQGVDGTKGAGGAQGENGTQGTNGPQGTDGTKGDTGSKGNEGSGGGGSAFNGVVRYLVEQNGSNYEINATVATKMLLVSWTRSGTNLTISSTAHGLSVGDKVVITNSNDTGQQVASIDSVTTDAFVVTTTNSGGTSGSEAQYGTLFTSTVTNTGGDVTGVVMVAPGGKVATSQLLSLSIFCGSQESALVLTLPSGLGEGAGGYSDKQEINAVGLTALNFAGTGTSGALSPSTTYNLSSNFNQISIGNIDIFEPVMLGIRF